jgi:hypothetical protein
VSIERSKQRAVIEFLLAENESITNIHRRLTNVYGDMAMDNSTVSRWEKRLVSPEQGQVNVSDLLRSGRPLTAVTPATMQRADIYIRNDRRITTRELAEYLVREASTISLPVWIFKGVCPMDPWKPNLRAQGTKKNHTPYSPDLAPSDYHLFSSLKVAIRGKKFEDEDEVISEVKRWLRQRPAEWYHEGIQAVTSRWRKATDLLKNRFR